MYNENHESAELQSLRNIIVRQLIFITIGLLLFMQRLLDSFVPSATLPPWSTSLYASC